MNISLQFDTFQIVWFGFMIIWLGVAARADGHLWAKEKNEHLGDIVKIVTVVNLIMMFAHLATLK